MSSSSMSGAAGIASVGSLTQSAVGSMTGAAKAAEGSDAKAASSAKVKEAAAQFEGIFVRQLLDAAKIMGSKGGSGGYGSMAVESLADGVVRAGGLGLARQIEDSMSRAEMSAKAAHFAASQVSPQKSSPDSSSPGASSRSEK